MDETARRLGQLVERLADRLCHDISSSSQAIASGLDLLREAAGPVERDEAIAFLGEALASQRAKVGYARRAFGPATQAADATELKDLALGLYVDIRPTLDWTLTASSLGPTAARTLLVLLHIAADALAVGGVARVSMEADGGLTVLATGPRVAVKDEVRAGLAGEAFDSGLAGRWVQGSFVAMLAAQAGGEVKVDAREGVVRFSVSLPAGA